MDYLLRPTLIAGDQMKDDYCVFHRIDASGGSDVPMRGPREVKGGSGT